MLAKDIMRKRVVTVSAQMTIREVAKLFGDRHITGAPVVSPEGKVVGVVSQTDLVCRERDSSPHEIPFYHRETEEGTKSSGFHCEDPDFARVEQVMTPWAISFEDDTPVHKLARQMLTKHIHRVIITRDGELCGIVTSMDMVRVLLSVLDGAQRAGEPVHTPRSA